MLTDSDRFSRIRAITEVAANCALVVAVAVGLSVLLRQRHTPIPVLGPELSATENLAVGTRIDLPGVDWSTHRQTLVLAISTACHFCVESTPFYSALTQSSHIASIVVAMPQDKATAQAFLRQHAITPTSTVSVPLSEIQVQGTPTLLLVSSTGKVTRSWVGELSKLQQQQVIRSLDHM